MPESIKNLYKCPGIFSCRHPLHKQFGYSVSPYHVIKLKKCHPSGCVEFLWRCHALEKGHPCPRKFKHVGRGCFSCKQYHEDKITHIPETNLDDAQLREFIDSMHAYQGWLESMNDKTVKFSGVIDRIQPHYKMTIEFEYPSIEMDGFYISFARGYFDNQLFDDKIYLKISGSMLDKTRLAEGDEVELDAIFSESRGRIILQRPRRLDITKNGNSRQLSLSKAIIARATGKIISGSIDQCKKCAYCSLVDIEDNSRQTTIYYRRFFCLRGVTDSENCPVRLERLFQSNELNQIR